MGDANPIRILGDYSKPSHEGYRNTIELPVGNNVKTLDYAAEGLLRKLSAEKAWATIEKLAHYEDEGWNDPVIPEEGSLDYENPNIEQLIGVMEYKVDTLMKNAISLMGRSKCVFRMTSNEMYQIPPEPSRQEEFEHIVINFILDQEERVKQLEEYMRVIVDDFMKLSSEVTRRLKEKIIEEGSRIRKIEKITKYSDIEVPKPLTGHKFLESSAKKKISETPKSIPTNSLWIGYVHPTFSNPPHFWKNIFGFKPGDVIDWEFLAYQNLDQAFFESINTDSFSAPQWANLFRVNEPIYQELVREFFASFEFEASACRLSRAETVKENRLLMEFWPSIRDGGFNVGNTKVTSIRNPRVKLAHWCIATTISGRKESTHRVTKIDLYYLYCIYTEGVVCNIPYWLAKYLKSVRDKSLICEGMFVTRIARSFELLTNEIRDALSVEPLTHIFKKKSLIAMGVVMELQNRICVWPATRAVEEDEAEEEAEGEAANVGGWWFAEMYRNMSQGNWQVRQARWMDQQEERWEQFDVWRGHQEAQANWMYDHTVRKFQYLSTRDNLEPHLQIDPFP
ncbi:hypothetical protein Tco_0812089 [Tanacetum coccineum]